MPYFAHFEQCAHCLFGHAALRQCLADHWAMGMHNAPWRGTREEKEDRKGKGRSEEELFVEGEICIKPPRRRYCSSRKWSCSWSPLMKSPFT